MTEETPVELDLQSDVTWIMSSTFIVFTMQSGQDLPPEMNVTTSLGPPEAIRAAHTSTHDDATWILNSAFITFTMQSGFGLLESGSVSVKNEVNIMVKNAVDVIFGGLTFWMLGYGISFGEGRYNNPFCGWGDFFVTASEQDLGWVYSKFFFQASFATTATTIVSGSMAERTKLEAYIMFSMLNTFIFCFPAHWIWASNGWLRTYGVIDIAGAGPVHLVGGLTGLVATIMLKPRHGRFRKRGHPVMGSPTNAILGMFMLWWGWLGFNCGSTFGISGGKWKLAARSAVSTITSSVAGGIVGLLLSYIIKGRRFDICYLINGILGSLVSVTAVCAVAQPWEGLVIGIIGAVITTTSVELLTFMHIDDPVGCVGTHACSGMWSLLSAGLFIKRDSLTTAILYKKSPDGLFYSGSAEQLGIQFVGCLAIGAWTVVTATIFLKVIDLVCGIRVSTEHEILGSDIVEHSVGGVVYCKRTKKIIPESSHDIHLREHGVNSNNVISADVLRRRPSLGLRLSEMDLTSETLYENRPLDKKRSWLRFLRWRKKNKTKMLNQKNHVNHRLSNHSIGTDHPIPQIRLNEDNDVPIASRSEVLYSCHSLNDQSKSSSYNSLFINIAETNDPVFEDEATLSTIKTYI